MLIITLLLAGIPSHAGWGMRVESAPDVSLTVGDPLPRPVRLRNACAGTTQPDYWLKQLHAPEPHVRAVAATALGETRQQAVVPALIKALHDQNTDVRLAAVYALGRIGPDAGAAIPALTLLLTDADAAVRAAAAGVLKRLVRPKPGS